MRRSWDRISLLASFGLSSASALPCLPPSGQNLLWLGLLADFGLNSALAAPCLPGLCCAVRKEEEDNKDLTAEESDIFTLGRSLVKLAVENSSGGGRSFFSTGQPGCRSI